MSKQIQVKRVAVKRPPQEQDQRSPSGKVTHRN